MLAVPIYKRKNEEEQRTFAIAELQNLIENTQKVLEAYLNGAPEYAHIEPQHMELVIGLCYMFIFYPNITTLSFNACVQINKVFSL